MLPLEGVRVLDLSRLLPGPYCSLILADLGADVVRVEAPGAGDYLRFMPPMMGEISGYFLALNRNKRSIVLDLKLREGVEVFLELVTSGFDVIIESFRPGVMDRLGLGYTDLRAHCPKVILCSISGYGQSGPRRERAGHDLNYMGLSGVLGLNGTVNSGPVMPGAQVADVGGGSLMGAIGLLAALHRRATSGEGSWIDISMTEGALALLSMHFGARRALQRPLAPETGVLFGEMPCYSVYRTADDRFMTLAAIEPRFWQGFCSAVGREDLEGAGLASGDEGRRVKEDLARIFSSKTQAEWIEHLSSHDVCCEPVYDGDDVFHDEHFLAREAFLEIDDPGCGSLRQVACPIRFVEGDHPPRRPAPRPGADTDSILMEAGLDPDALSDLRKKGVID